MTSPKPAPVPYSERLKDRRQRFAVANRANERLGNARLGLLALGLVLVLLPLYTRGGTPWLLLIPLGVVFFVLGRIHDRVLERRRRQQASVRFYEDGLSRLDETWRRLPDDGADLSPVTLPEGSSVPKATWAVDLDLFGPASLFQLLNRSVTVEGRTTLASWISTRSDPDVVMARQAAVAELSQQLDFCEALNQAAAGEDRAPVPNEALLSWGDQDRSIPAAGLLTALGIFFPLLLASAITYYVISDELLPLLIVSLAQIALLFGTKPWTSPRATVLSGPERVLVRYARLFEVADGPEFESPLLKELQGILRVEGRSAHEHVKSLVRWVELLDARLNVFFALSLGPALLWELNLVLRTERWRKQVGPRLPAWFKAIGAIEALASLAALARERPDYTMPEFESGPASYRAEQLSHPLIDKHQVVANDVDLGTPGYVMLLSGSNMSGKSTLLRAVGLSTVLAQCGAPVPARRLRMTPFRLETSVRIVDSLAEGTSHFYAELARLKTVMDAADGQHTLLYLLDEVLHGTNSRERIIGAMAVIQHLSRLGAIGIVTTHDLGLAQVQDHLPKELVVNRHFSDSAEEGTIRFDYHLREGPIATTNALRLMRQIGIDLDFDSLEAALDAKS